MGGVLELAIISTIVVEWFFPESSQLHAETHNLDAFSRKQSWVAFINTALH